MEVCFTLKRPYTANFNSEQLAAAGSCRYRPLPAQTNRGFRPSAAVQPDHFGARKPPVAAAVREVRKVDLSDREIELA